MFYGDDEEYDFEGEFWKKSFFLTQSLNKSKDKEFEKHYNFVMDYEKQKNELAKKRKNLLNRIEELNNELQGVANEVKHKEKLIENIQSSYMKLDKWSILMHSIISKNYLRGKESNELMYNKIKHTINSAFFIKLMRSLNDPYKYEELATPKKRYLDSITIVDSSNKKINFTILNIFKPFKNQGCNLCLNGYF